MCKSKQEDLNGLLLMFIEEVSNAARTWQLRWVCGNVCSSCQWLCDFQTLPETGKCEHAWGSQRELALSSQVFEVRSRAKSQNSSLTTRLLSRINLVNSMTAATSLICPYWQAACVANTLSYRKWCQGLFTVRSQSSDQVMQEPRILPSAAELHWCPQNSACGEISFGRGTAGPQVVHTVMNWIPLVKGNLRWVSSTHLLWFCY